MKWRFADLPIRTKFLVTLGIPVVGLVLLIGKQVDGSIKRRNVLGYFSIQSRNIRLLGELTHALQEEGAQSVAWRLGVEVNAQRLALRTSITDQALMRLNDPALMLDHEMRPLQEPAVLARLRREVQARALEPAAVEAAYQRLARAQLDRVGMVFGQARDPEISEKLFAHMNLLNAKEAFNDARIRVLRVLLSDARGPEATTELYGHIAQYESDLALFDRDAPPDARELYQRTYRGEQVNFVHTIVATIHEKRSMAGLHVGPQRWWDLSGSAFDLLHTVEERTIEDIIRAKEVNAEQARNRLLLVIGALLGVVGAVVVMGYVILRGIRNTVEEVTSATSALAIGDVRAHVPVNTRDEIGQMAVTFNRMIDNIRSLAASADAIGKGNYDTDVPLRGDQDVLGQALARMRDNLKAARDRDMEQNQALQQEKEKLERANERIRVLIKEIHHRVKNNLQVVASLLRLQSDTIDDPRLREVFGQSQSRVASMALIHEKLYKGDDLVQLDIGQYVQELFAELVQLNNVRDTIRYHARVDPGMTLDLDTMVPLGLVLNELITNSFKHAFQGRAEGLIDLRLSRSGEREFDLMYTDNGVGIPPGRLNGSDATLGMSLIDSLVEQMNGHLTVESDQAGTRYHIRFRT